MAAASLLVPSPSPISSLRRRLLPSSLRLSSAAPLARFRRSFAVPAASSSPTSPLEALIFDCDGVILESEHLHRQAYNDAFERFFVRCPASSSSSSSQPLHWDTDFYDELQNRIDGGKPKMRWYFKENGWPSSSIFETPPSSDSEREKLIDVIQASVTTIAGGKSNIAGYRDGPSEDSKFSSDFDVVYVGRPCSLIVVDRGNAALRQISLQQED